MNEEFFTARKALSDYREGKTRWTGGALIVRAGEGFQAIPGAYLNDISYLGSRVAVSLAEVRAEARKERP